MRTAFALLSILLGAGVLPLSSTPQVLGDMVKRDLAQVREMAKTVRMAAE